MSKRNKGITVRLNEQEREHLDFLARSFGITPSEVLRGILALQPTQVMKLTTIDTASIRWQDNPATSSTPMIIQHRKIPA